MYKGHKDEKINIYTRCQSFIVNNDLKPNLIVDFGAHFGESFQFLSKFCRKHYVFIEPCPSSIQEIQKVMAAIKDDSVNVHLINSVLGEENGQTKLVVFPESDNQSANLFSDRGRSSQQSVEIVDVPVMSYKDFSEYFPQKIDFAKINIEGAEYKLIEDGFFKDKIDSFVMEIHNIHVPGKTWRDAVSMLENDFDIETFGDLNYKYCFMSGKRCM